MKLLSTFLTVCLCASGLVFNETSAQEGNPLVYMNKITGQYVKLQQKTWDYTRSAAHAQNAKKIDKRRQQLLSSIENAMIKVNQIGDYQGDSELRLATLNFLDISYNVISEDYDQVIDMKEVSEQSYDQMEAYMFAKKRAGEKLKDASFLLSRKQLQFANTHNIKLVSSNENLIHKMAEAGKIINYYNDLYLQFFKCYKQELLMLRALSAGNVSGIEQNKSALQAMSTEALEVLDTINRFASDSILLEACKDMVEFYTYETKDQIDVLTEYHLRHENYLKIRQALEAIKEENRTNEDVQKYNHAIESMNSAINDYNITNRTLNGKRKTLLVAWNEARVKFIDRHMPNGR